MHLDLEEDEKLSLWITLISVAAILISLSIVYYLPNSEIAIALLAGGLGGIGHEFAQSSGTISFIKKKEDGVYLGSIAGIILGMIAGLLLFQNFPTLGKEVLIAEALLAGLGLKGVAEAVGGQATGGNKQSWYIENSIPVGANLLIDVRNTGTDNVTISKIYVDTRPAPIAATVIYPDNVQQFSINTAALAPPLVPGVKHDVQVVSAKGKVKTFTFV